jgi:hypothetical protein
MKSTRGRAVRFAQAQAKAGRPSGFQAVEAAMARCFPRRLSGLRCHSEPSVQKASHHRVNRRLPWPYPIRLCAWPLDIVRGLRLQPVENALGSRPAVYQRAMLNGSPLTLNSHMAKILRQFSAALRAWCAVEWRVLHRDDYLESLIFNGKDAAECRVSPAR